MEIEDQASQATTEEQFETVETQEETVVEPNPLQERLDKEIEARKQLTARAIAAEREKKALEAKLNASQGAKPALDVEDYIDISASLEGLDQKEKEYLAQQHKQSGKTLGEIRNDENFQLWQSAYRTKAEKERLTLTPSSAQADSDRPKSLTEKLANASLADKEKILVEAGLYKQVKHRTDKVNIGGN